MRVSFSVPIRSVIKVAQSLPDTACGLEVEEAHSISNGHVRFHVDFKSPIDAGVFCASLDGDEVRAAQFKMYWFGEE